MGEVDEKGNLDIEIEQLMDNSGYSYFISVTNQIGSMESVPRHIC